MIKKISRKKFLASYPQFAQANHYKNIYTFPEAYDSYVLYVEAISSTGLCNHLSAAIINLAKALGYNDLFFLGDSTIPWLYNSHDYPPVHRALNYLAANNISKSFNGGIEVNGATLPVFLKHLFWLVRCNGVLFYPHFSDAGFNIIASICQYGNLHLSILNKETDEMFNKVLAQTQFSLLEDNNCGGGRIAGRTASL